MVILGFSSILIQKGKNCEKPWKTREENAGKRQKETFACNTGTNV
jgi:hypothetical protein